MTPPDHNHSNNPSADSNLQLSVHAQKSKIMSDLRHDVRGPMHVIGGLTTLLNASDTLTARQHEMTLNLQSSADHLFALIENMIAYMEVLVEKADDIPPFRAAQIPSPVKPQMPDKPFFKLAAADDAPVSRHCILVVEDYAPNVLVVTTLLDALGYDCDVACNGKEALSKFSLNRYDVILMDIQIPGIDGLEVSRRIRSLEKTEHLNPTPIIASTGNVNCDDQIFFSRAGINDFLSKPFTQDALESKLQNLVKARSPEYALLSHAS